MTWNKELRAIRSLRSEHHANNIEPRVVNINWDLGKRCNYDCSYCSPTIHDWTSPHHSVETVNSFVSQVDTWVKSQNKTFNISLTGGEPFLHNNLFNILTSLKSVPEVIIWSGLGVNFQRFKNILSRLSEFPNVILYISGENIEGLMELNRYGNKWNDFEKKINLIKEYKIKFLFHSVLSNLTIFGFDKFLDIYREYVLSYTFVYKPDFMAVYVMDEKSKESIIEKFEHDPLPWKDYIFKSLNAEPTHLQRSNLKVFLKEFSQRRQLNVNNLYPESFLKWVNDVV